MRDSAARSSWLGSRGSTLGKGLRARSFWSVLPPPSRFAWASASAFCGFAALFALTSTTSMMLWGASHLGTPGSLNPRPTIRNACIAIEAMIATCMEATIPKRSSRKSEKETSASGEGCLNCIGSATVFVRYAT